MCGKGASQHLSSNLSDVTFFPQSAATPTSTPRMPAGAVSFPHPCPDQNTPGKPCHQAGPSKPLLKMLKFCQGDQRLFSERTRSHGRCCFYYSCHRGGRFTSACYSTAREELSRSPAPAVQAGDVERMQENTGHLDCSSFSLLGNPKTKQRDPGCCGGPSAVRPEEP